MKILGRILLGLVLALVLVGCGSAAGGPETERADDPIKADVETADPAISETPSELEISAAESNVETFQGSDSREEDCGDDTKEVSLSGSGGTFTLSVPESWECIGLLQTEEDSSYSLRIKPEAGLTGHISIFYDSCFGVCGTGLEEEEIELAGDKAFAGYYDGHTDWDFIIFKGKNEKIVALNQAWDWCAAYQEEIMAALNSLRYEPDKISGDARIAYQGNTAFGVFLCTQDITRAKADLYFRRHQGDPEQTIYYGEDFSLQVHDEENKEWIPANGLSLTPAFKAVSYNLPFDEYVDISIDWKDIYGDLQPGLYFLSKTVVDGDYDPDYDGLQSVDLRVFFRVY